MDVTINITTPTTHVALDAGVAAIGSVTVSNLPVTQPISGAVSVSNFPATQPVSIATAPALVASSAMIGHVVADSGSTVVVTALPALPAGSNAIGSVTVTSAPTTAVTIATAPALVASSAMIGHVIADSGSTTAVTSLPSIPAGANAIGSVIVTSAPTTAVTIASLPALAAGSAAIGSVTLAAGSAIVGHIIADSGSTTAVTSLPAIPTGSNTIGAVTGPAAAALALESTQVSGNASLTTIATNSPSLVGGRIPVAEGGSQTTDIVTLALTGLLVKSGPGTLEYCHVYNANSTACILMVFDLATATLVSGTTKPIFQTSTISTSAPGNLAPTKPMNFTNGCVLAASLTAGLFTTNTGTNPTFVWGHVTFK